VLNKWWWNGGETGVCEVVVSIVNTCEPITLWSGGICKLDKEGCKITCGGDCGVWGREKELGKFMSNEIWNMRGWGRLWWRCRVWWRCGRRWSRGSCRWTVVTTGGEWTANVIFDGGVRRWSWRGRVRGKLGDGRGSTNRNWNRGASLDMTFDLVI
jgi:hypothetical protein